MEERESFFFCFVNRGPLIFICIRPTNYITDAVCEGQEVMPERQGLGKPVRGFEQGLSRGPICVFKMIMLAYSVEGQLGEDRVEARSPVIRVGQ